MGLVSRHAGAPFANGETADATDVETDFNNIVSELNGNLDDANIKAAAAIQGSKLASGTVTPTQVSAAVLAKGAVYTASDATVLTTSTTLVDAPGWNTLTVTPGSVNDLIVLDCIFKLDLWVQVYDWAFSINGVDTGLIAQTKKNGASDDKTRTLHYMKVAGVTTPVQCKVRQKASGAGADTYDAGYERMFRVFVLPVK